MEDFRAKFLAQDLDFYSIKLLSHLIEGVLGDGFDVAFDFLAGRGQHCAVIVLYLVGPRGLNRFRHSASL